jgi:DNA-binding transcriptional regulator YdaS (Cro superfamily)
MKTRITTSAAINEAGNAAKLAKTLGITRSAISQWGRFVPPGHRTKQILRRFPDIKVTYPRDHPNAK